MAVFHYCTHPACHSSDCAFTLAQVLLCRRCVKGNFAAWTRFPNSCCRLPPCTFDPQRTYSWWYIDCLFSKRFLPKNKATAFQSFPWFFQLVVLQLLMVCWPSILLKVKV
ncbi:unnamed protein product, partial [Nesidiocoris tenuis]